MVIYTFLKPICDATPQDANTSHQPLKAKCKQGHKLEDNQNGLYTLKIKNQPLKVMLRLKIFSEFQVTERNAPLPNIRGHTYVPWAASGTSQLGCSAESHHHGVWRWFGYTAAAASNTASRSSPGNVH